MIIPPAEMPIGKYHKSAPRWWSKSTLRLYQSMGAPWMGLYLQDLVEAPQPDGTEQGSALDCLLTEGLGTFLTRYPRRPPGAPKRPTKAQLTAKKPSQESIDAIAYWKAWDAANPGAIILSDEDHAILQEAAAAVRRLPCWKEIEESQAQATVRRDAPQLGIGLQSRPDWIHTGRGRLRDLKKTRDLDMFGRQAIDLGYHLQAAVASWCLAGDSIGVEQASLVAVEWQRGARAREYIIPHEALVDGDRQMRDLARDVADRLARNDWTDQQTSPELLPIPEYMLRRMSEAA